MIPLTTSLVVCILSFNIAFVQGQFTPFHFDIVHDSFLKFPNSTNSANVTQTTKQVTSKASCIEDCIDTPGCLSINFKKSAEANGLHLCEFLSSDIFKNKQHLQKNKEYIHYSLKVNNDKLNKLYIFLFLCFKCANYP